jgi:hypothetical protein
MVGCAVVVSLLAGCGGGGEPTGSDHPSSSAPTEATGAEPVVESVPTTYDDGYHHLVLLTENAPTGGEGDEVQRVSLEADTTAEAAQGAAEAPPATPESSDTTGDADAHTTGGDADAHTGTGTAAGAASGHLAVEVVRADGTTGRARVPDGSLPVVLPRSAAEAELLAEHGAELLAVLVADVDGVVGAAGRRYVLVPGRLIEVAVDPAGAVEGGDAGGDPAAGDSSGGTDQAPPASGDVAAPATAAPPGPPAGAPSDEQILDVVRGLAGTVRAAIVGPGVISVVTTGDREILRRVAGVVSVDTDVLFDLGEEPQQALQWMIRNTGSPAQASGWPGVAGADANLLPAWTVSRGAGRVIAVVDTGVALDHPDLAPNLWANPGETCANGIDDDRNGHVDDCHGWDFGSNDSIPDADSAGSPNDHGTHVAGIAAAAVNGVGIAGAAPDSGIMAVKVSYGSAMLPMSAIYSGIVYAVENGADVVNLSLGSAVGTPRSAVALLEQAIALAATRNVVVVAAAGNAGADVSTAPTYPAGFSQFYPNVVSVGATTNTDTRASFSNYGRTVDLWAPGAWIYSATVGGHSWKSGTSMAAPVVAGAAAVLLASGQVGSAPAVRTRLVATADATAAGPRLDVGRAVGREQLAEVAVSYGGVDGLVADRPGTVTVEVRGDQPPAGAAQAQLSIAARVGSEVYAVAGLAVTVTADGAAPVVLTTDDSGSLPPLALDPQLLPAGWRIAADLVLPAGDFALVTELLDASGAPVGGTHAGYVTIGDAPPEGGGGGGGTGGGGTTLPGTSPPGTTSPAPPGTVPPVTTSPAPPTGTAPAPTSPAPTSPAPTSPAPTPSSVPGATPSSLPVVSTTTPGAGSAPAPSPSPSSPSPSTPAPSTSTPPTSATSTTSALAPPPGSTSPATSVPSAPPTTTPPTTAPPTTTPPPEPDTSGPWRLDSMSPRAAPVTGGTAIELLGRFPRSVPVHVWFGDAVVEAVSTGDALYVRTPAVNREGVVDVSVRFQTSAAHVLTLEQAFTFSAPPPSPGPGTTLPGPAPTPTTSPTPGPGTTPPPLPPAPGPGTTLPSPAPTPPTPTPTPTTPTPTPTTPTTAPPAPATTVPALGSLTLRARPATGALSRVSAQTWPAAGCRSARCPATTI